MTSSFIAADFLLGMLRQMLGIVAAHEAGIGLLAKGAGEHPLVEGGSLGLVDAVLGMAEAGKGGRSRPA